MDRQVSRSTRSKPSVDWSRLIAAHTDAMRQYEAAAEVAPDEFELEDELDDLLRNVVQIEQRALRQPAPDIAALRFKFRLWADGRVVGYEEEWRILTQDFERFSPRE